MLNKKSILLLTICILILIIGTLSFANTEDFFTLGKEVKDILESDNNAIVARGQKWEITEAQLDVFTKKYEISYERLENDSKKHGFDIPDKKTRDDLLKDMIKEEILYQEAISKGMDTSKEEAEKVMLQQRKFIEDVLNSQNESDKEQVEEQYKELQDFASGMGLTVDEYFQEAIPGYQRVESIQKLKENILSNSAKENNKAEEIEKIWDEYTLELINNSEYEVIK